MNLDVGWNAAHMNLPMQAACHPMDSWDLLEHVPVCSGSEA